jgi:hypothetical protein
VVRGRDKGKIGKVFRVDEDTESVTVEGLNTVRPTSFLSSYSGLVRITLIALLQKPG